MCESLERSSAVLMCIKNSKQRLSLLFLNHYHLHSQLAMVLPQDSSKYLSLYDSSPPRSRQSSAGLGASIWAPQPQPSETAWPRALDSFSRVTERDTIDFHGLNGHQKPPSLPLISREDVFGSLNPMTQSTKDIGAIGDGRKKNTPEYEDTVSICYQ